MSLYYVPGGISHARLMSVARELARTSDRTVMHAGAGGFLWVVRDPRRFGPAHDPATDVRIITSGHLVGSAHEWSRAERLPYEGGLGPRLLLERYLNGGPDAVAPYNGSTIAVVHDPRVGAHHIYTDQFGYHPCFLYRGDDSAACIVTTFPDALLADDCVELSFDRVSMAEFVRAWRSTPPHTYFREVKHAGAAVHVTVDTRANRVSRKVYWQPFESGFYRSIGEASEALSEAVKSAVFERTAIANRPLFFVSGGADSRALLFSAADRSKVVGVTIYEHASQETEIARRLCEAAGTRFVALQRDNDYYPRQLADIVRWSGGMWSAEDAHYPGMEAALAESDPDLVMTACTADWLFKGYGLEKEHVPLFGRSLPFLRYLDRRSEGFLPNVPLSAPPHFSLQVQERMDAWFAGCPDQFTTPQDRLIVEDRRIRPACYTVSVSGQIMYRSFPYDTPFADSRIAGCYSRIHPDWKLNREVWGKAAARICGEADQIVDANWGWKIDASPAEKAFVFFTGWFGRRLKRLMPQAPQSADRPPSAGSWPDYGWYAVHSERLKQLWHSVTLEERERMVSVTGTDHWSRPLTLWRADGNQLFRLLTLLCHWRECDLRRQRKGLAPVADIAISG